MEWQLLRDLTAAERRQVLAKARRRQFKRGEVLFHEGDPADTVHFIAEGRVMARRTSPMGDSVAFRVIGPGRALGDVAVVSSSRRRSSTVSALEPTTTLRQCEAHPGIQALLANLLAARVKRLSDHLLEALFLPTDRRVIRRLLDLCQQYEVGPDRTVVIPLTQTDIAELAGATRPSTNRVLRTLEAEGLLQLRRGQVEVVDRLRLQLRDS
jgi:CRP/FNR family cyclic AMP-dependent transcriptional regulator